MTYQYWPLVEPDAIRFIVLQPDKDINARVQCLWIHITLTECNDDVVEHYRVLAYVWGDPRITTPTPPPSPLTVAISNLQSTLESVLHHMRGPLRTRKVGSDGVCINQSNAEEKCLQVGQMESLPPGEAYNHLLGRRNSGNGIIATTGPFVDLQRK